MTRIAVHPDYRPDVDGLRALAVLSVVGYHGHVPWLGGGYLGVDIFFVISGYVITRQLLREFEQSGCISLSEFWQRRIARLWPAILLVLAFVLLATPLLVSRLSGEVGPMARAALVTVALNANHFFLIESRDYFAAAAESNPLLHMWSLSVEEQFYWLWPIALLVALRKLQLRAIWFVVIAAALVSLVAYVLLTRDNPGAAFYLLPSRAWQLLAGALLAVSEMQTRERGKLDERIRSALGWGAVGIFGACLAFDPRTQRDLMFVPAIAVVGSTATLIWMGRERSDQAVTRLLSMPLLVYVGRISFPLYLWHWPLFAITRSARLYENSPFADTLTILVAIALAVVTYELIEKRTQRWLRSLPKRRAFAGWGMSALFLATFALLVGAWTRFGWGYGPREAWLDAARHDHAEVGCIFKDAYPTPDQERSCYPRKWPASVLMWGDSHGQHWSPAFAALAAESRVDYAAFNLGGCRPLPRVIADARCGTFYRAVAEHVPQWRANSGLKGVVLSARWAEGTGAIPLSTQDQAQSAQMGFDDKAARSRREALEMFARSLRSQLVFLRDHQLKVLVILPTPNQRFAAVHCLAVRTNDQCASTRAENDQYSGDVKRIMRSVVSEFDNARAIDAEPWLCDQTVCPAVVQDVVAYSDDDHLSQSWVRLAIPKLRSDFAWLIAGEDFSARATKQVP